VSWIRRLNTAIAHGLGLAAERWSYGRGRTRVLAAVSRGVARELKTHYPAAQIALAPNGVDLERFRPDSQVRHELRSAEAVDEDELVILFVGGDWDRKGLAIAIEALAHAARARVDTLRLWVVGRGDVTRFRRLAAQVGVANQVQFLGPRSDSERFYQAADVFVLPSHYEAFPLVSLEAAASGLPIVATPVNGVEELVDEDNGFVVKRTPEAFGEALLRLASDPERRKKMGESARRRAAMYTWQRSTGSVLEIYRELLGSTPLRERAMT
jgi:UDP-glucose:(heptosyl)LPS alpha-1,3-glucosyltransferase